MIDLPGYWYTWAHVLNNLTWILIRANDGNTDFFANKIPLKFNYIV